MFKHALVAAAALLSATSANAAVVLFSDFDSTVTPTMLADGYEIFTSVEGWTGGDNGLELQYNNVAGLPLSPLNLVELDTTANSSMYVVLRPGRYKVSYYYSARPDEPDSTNGISLAIGSTLLDSVSETGGSQTSWQLRSVTFKTGGDELRFSAFGTSDGVGGYLDNVLIETAAVPEPATWGMLLTGFALVGFAARRRRDVVAA